MTDVVPGSKEGDGSVVTTQIKSINFDDLMKSDATPNGGPETPPYDDLATIEENKKRFERTAHEQESFCSWFCCRCLCCDGYFPCYWPHNFWVGGNNGDCCDCNCCGSGDGDCCGDDCCTNCDCDCDGCCTGCCEGCGSADCGGGCGDCGGC